MRQAVITRHGPPEVFEMREGPDPVPSEGLVRIRVGAAGVNFADILSRLGLYPDAPKPPVVVDQAENRLHAQKAVLALLFA